MLVSTEFEIWIPDQNPVKAGFFPTNNHSFIWLMSDKHLEGCMPQIIDFGLERAMANGTVNAYILELLTKPRFDSGDVVQVPKERLRFYIRSAREELRGRQGTVQHHAQANQYLVRFEETRGKPAFEKIIPLVNLEKVR
jgi:hypothetical protein